MAIKKRSCMVDADTYLYRAAVVLQKDSVMATYLPKNTKKEFKNKTEFKTWLKSQDKYVESQFKLENISKITGTVDDGFYSVKKKIEEIMESPYVRDVSFCIGGDAGNFRYNVGRILPYKGDRPEKPLLFAPLRDKVIKHLGKWGDIVVQPKTDIEVDDLVSMHAWKAWREKNDGVMISYCDKDLNQIPGWRMDYWDYTKEPTYVGELEAYRFFCAQCLAGDKGVDNIQGIHSLPNSLRESLGIRKAKGGVTIETAKKLVEEYYSIEDLTSLVVKCYKESYPEGHTLEDGSVMSWVEVMDENARLLKLLEYSGQVFSFSESAKKMGVEL